MVLCTTLARRHSPRQPLPSPRISSVDTWKDATDKSRHFYVFSLESYFFFKLGSHIQRWTRSGPSFTVYCNSQSGGPIGCLKRAFMSLLREIDLLHCVMYNLLWVVSGVLSMYAIYVMVRTLSAQIFRDVSALYRFHGPC